jgi:predicted amidophosphoribosyltransferase
MSVLPAVIASVNLLPFFIGAIVVLTAIPLGAMLLQIRPTRPCPLCNSRVELSARRCKACGYEISPIRLSR